MSFLNEITSNYKIIRYKHYKVLIPLNDYLMPGYLRCEFVNMIYSKDYLIWIDGTRIPILRDEIWRDLPVVEHDSILYFADKDGNPKYMISNVGRMKEKSTGENVLYGDEGNYLKIEDNGRNFMIHRLVYFVFSATMNNNALFDNSFHIDHQNGCKLDNQFGNLQAVTPSDNLKNKANKHISDFYTFKAPEIIKSPKSQYSSNQKPIIIDDEFIILSRRDMNGLLRRCNTKSYNIGKTKNGLFMKKYKIDYMNEEDTKIMMEDLAQHFVDGDYDNVIGGRY